MVEQAWEEVAEVAAEIAEAAFLAAAVVLASQVEAVMGEAPVDQLVVAHSREEEITVEMEDSRATCPPFLKKIMPKVTNS